MEPFEEFQPEKSPLRDPGAGSRWPIVVAAAVVLAGVAAYFLFFAGRGEVPPAPVAEPEPAVEAPAPAADEEDAAPIELPPLDRSDAVVRRLVAALSANPDLARWLATDDLVRRFTALVDNVAQGESPRSHAAGLAPATPFRAVEAGGRHYLDPAAYRRYDRVADVVAAVDARAAVRLYRTLAPLIDAAYRDLGYPDRDFNRTLRQAIDSLLAVPVVEGDVELVPGVRSYAFADRRLEGLTAAQKHLLRMGPENVRRIQAKLREIAALLG